jgi:hypothetical protein
MDNYIKKWIDENPELRGEVNEIIHRWTWEFDTKKNRQLMSSEILELINYHISKKRDDRIDSILNDKS